MFPQLSDKLQEIFKELRGHGTISESNIDAALRHVRLALLEADVDFQVATRGAMISVTRGVCDRSHWGRAKDRAGQEGLMASHPMGPGSAVPPSEWHSSSHAYASGQMMACLRAGVIALVLLGILALIVLL